MDFIWGGFVFEYFKDIFYFFGIDVAFIVIVEYFEALEQQLIMHVLVVHALLEQIAEVIEVHGGSIVGEVFEFGDLNVLLVLVGVLAGIFVVEAGLVLGGVLLGDG